MSRSEIALIAGREVTGTESRHWPASLGRFARGDTRARIHVASPRPEWTAWLWLSLAFAADILILLAT